MKYEFNFDEEKGIITYVSKQALSLLETMQATTELAAFALEKDCYLLLSDLRQTEAKLDITDLLDLTKYYKKIPFSEKFKNAILYSEKTSIKANIEFYEILCNTAGYRTKAFTDKDKAILWLQNNHCANSCRQFNIPL